MRDLRDFPGLGFFSRTGNVQTVEEYAHVEREDNLFFVVISHENSFAIFRFRTMMTTGLILDCLLNSCSKRSSRGLSTTTLLSSIFQEINYTTIMRSICLLLGLFAVFQSALSYGTLFGRDSEPKRCFCRHDLTSWLKYLDDCRHDDIL